jgi:hypothetical protein
MDDWDDRLALLEEMPEYLAGLRPFFPGDRARERSAPDAFSYVEHVWHLADLEAEGFAERIRRLLAEEAPELPDFDGARIAAERDYRARDVAEGLAAFSFARSRNLHALRRLTDEDRARAGVQEGVGPVRLGEIPLRIHEHDHSHRGELEELVRFVVPV